ncbi:hypothetical protein DMENIID0001_030850 [Sergentomyia squamirostris]
MFGGKQGRGRNNIHRDDDFMTETKCGQLKMETTTTRRRETLKMLPQLEMIPDEHSVSKDSFTHITVCDDVHEPDGKAQWQQKLKKKPPKKPQWSSIVFAATSFHCPLAYEAMIVLWHLDSADCSGRLYTIIQGTRHRHSVIAGREIHRERERKSTQAKLSSIRWATKDVDLLEIVTVILLEKLINISTIIQ